MIPDLSGGGAERVIVTLLKHIDRSRFEPHLALVNAVGAYLPDVPNDIELHDLKARRARYCLKPLAKLVWRVRPQILLSTLGYLNLLVILAKPILPSNMKLVVREATIASAHLREYGSVSNVFSDYLYRLLYRRATVVLCQSRAMRDDLAHHFQIPDDRLRIIFNPVDLVHMELLGLKRPAAFSRCRYKLVAVGRLVHAKGFDILIDAMAEILKSLPMTHLWILGEGELKADLQLQAEQLGLMENVHFEGFQQNPFGWMKHADAVIQSSHSEGLPNVLIEAAGLGTPIIALDRPGGTAEILDEEGIGLPVQGAAPELARSIVDFLSGRISLLSGEERSRFINRKFGLERVVSQYEGMFTQLAGQG